jgi:hypothetical protein
MRKEGFNIKKVVGLDVKDVKKMKKDKQKKRKLKRKKLRNVSKPVLVEGGKIKQIRERFERPVDGMGSAFRYRSSVGELREDLNRLSNALLIDMIEGNSSRFVDFYKGVFGILGEQNVTTIDGAKGPMQNLLTFFDDVEISDESKNEVFEQLVALVDEMDNGLVDEMDDDMGDDME